MAIDSIGAVGNVQVAAAQASVGLEDFLQIFLTQLNYQDPLEPVDNREFLAQLAQFSSVEIANRTSETTTALLDVNSLSQSIGLLGKTVNVNLEQGSATEHSDCHEFSQWSASADHLTAKWLPAGASPTQVSTIIDLGQGG